MISEQEFLQVVGNPSTEDEAQIAVGKWLAEQIGHDPQSITYQCLAHINGVSFCAYADGPVFLGMTFADIAKGEALVAPVDPSVDTRSRIEGVMAAMKTMCKGEAYEYAAMCRDLVKMLGVDPLEYEVK